MLTNWGNGGSGAAVTQEGSHGAAGCHHPHACCHLLERSRGAKAAARKVGEA